MLKRILIVSALAAVLSAPAWTVAQEAPKTQKQEEIREKAQQQIYGSQLMTPQERAEFRAKMRSLKTPKERDEFRREHHKMMVERAKQRGVTLPDEPPTGPGHMGPGGGGMGPGGKMGPGGSMGPGGGMAPGSGGTQ